MSKEFWTTVGGVVVGFMLVDLLQGMGWTPGELIADRRANSTSAADA